MIWLLPLAISVLCPLVAGEICPLLGPAFPAPSRLATSPAFQAAHEQLVSKMEELMHPPSSSSEPATLDPDNLSFSLQIYTGHADKPVIEYYYTGTNMRNNTVGVNKVDEDTVFRIGSCSKVLTVLALLIERGDASFAEPVAKYVPEIRRFVAELKKNSTVRDDMIDYLRWDEVTIGELASQMSGMERQYGFGDLGQQPALMVPYGFPSLPESELPPCTLQQTCDRAQFFQGLHSTHPIFPTSSTPTYSNDAFQLLAYALEAMTGKPFQSLVQDTLTAPLVLSETTVTKPPNGVGIIPGLPNATFWDIDIGDIAPAGGIYSSTKDMSKLGRAILTHELLSPALTRRWLKKVSRTADPAYSVGSPWEIISLTKPRTIDLHTKAGDIGSYSSMMGLSLDHNAGFTILAASPLGPHAAVSKLSDLVATIVIPALDEAAREEANNRFTGTYTAPSGNSSITIGTDDGPGLTVVDWVSNSKDMLVAWGALLVGASPPYVDIRLYPTGLESPGKISFRAVASYTGPPLASAGPISGVCQSWLLVDGLVYGGVGMDEFVFELDTDGKAVRVVPRALRVSLEKSTG